MSFMQRSLTNGVKTIVRAGLWCYFKKINIVGFSKETHHMPVIYMGNHQNALIDALLIAVNTKRKTTFITRSDVFKNPLLGSFLRYIGMLPIYRFRDGVNTLKMNTPIFKSCGKVLAAKESILIFPEGNHGLQRRLRPLKKGFLSILNEYWELTTSAAVISPIGLNYSEATQFPDSVSVVFGPCFEVKPFVINTPNTKLLLVKVFKALQPLTAHIPLQEPDLYENYISALKLQGDDFLDPVVTNKRIAVLSETLMEQVYSQNKVFKTTLSSKIIKQLFNILNVIPIFIWRCKIKPSIVQEEFISTLRFAFSMVFFPIYFLFVGTVFFIVTKNIGTALAVPMGLFLLNLIMVKKLL